MAQPNDCSGDQYYDPDTQSCVGGGGTGGGYGQCPTGARWDTTTQACVPDTAGGGTGGSGACPEGTTMAPDGICRHPEGWRPTGGGGGGEGEGGDDWPTFFGSKRPDFSFGPAPRLNLPRYKLPTLEEARSEPGFQAALEAQTKGLDFAAAARGDARTGGHLLNVATRANALGDQNYGNVVNRSFGVYDRLVNAMMGEFSPLMDEYKLKFGANQRAGELGWDREWQKYLSELDRYRWFNPSADAVLNAEMGSL